MYTLIGSIGVISIMYLFASGRAHQLADKLVECFNAK